MKPSYYAVKKIKNLPANLVELGADDSTREFLREAKVRRSATKDALASVLKNVGYSLTDANGIVDRGRMFLFGQGHLEKLFGGKAPTGRLLLDVGAGDGNITAHVAAGGFEKVIATEFSSPMVKRLRLRGYHATADVDAIGNREVMGRHSIDLVMMLNVLDRADKPLTLLKELRNLVKPDTGRILLAVVLPWCPFVEHGKEQRKPSERLPMRGGTCSEGASFEESVGLMAEKVLIPAGFEIVSWSKLPYLCEGDGKKDYYVLDDAVFVLKRRPLEGEDESKLEPVEPGILATPVQPETPVAGVADWLFQKMW